MLRPKGKLLIIDWKKTKEACSEGPPLGHRIEEANVMHVLEESGFTSIQPHDCFQWHYGISAIA